jgi:hypothetical protein
MHTAIFPQNAQEMKMRKIILSTLAAVMVTGLTAQMAMASEHHAYKAYRDNFRGARNELVAPSYVTPGIGFSRNWRDDAKVEPAGN